MRARPKSLIFDIYGAYVRPLGGWIAIADLIILMGDLGIDSHAVRSSVSRLTHHDMLVRKGVNGQSGYELSPAAESILQQGDRRIFASMKPANLNDGWILAVFSVPEDEREKRHQLRSQLTWHGFGSLGGGVWMAPRRVKEAAEEALKTRSLETYVDMFEGHYLGFDNLVDLVARCWNLDDLNARYADFVVTVRPLLNRWKRRGESGGHRNAFIDYTTLLHQWRKLPYLDPGLPQEFLPSGWQGRVASDLFLECVERLEKRAKCYAESVIASPPNGPETFERSSAARGR